MKIVRAVNLDAATREVLYFVSQEVADAYIEKNWNVKEGDDLYFREIEVIEG